MEHGVTIYGELALISGSGNPALAQEISDALGLPPDVASVALLAAVLVHGRFVRARRWQTVPLPQCRHC